MFETIAAEAAAESPLWGEALRADPERVPVFGALVPERFALGVETIYEGYLLHYGRPRLFAPPDEDVGAAARRLPLRARPRPDRRDRASSTPSPHSPS